jgi:hypothetical protein
VPKFRRAAGPPRDLEAQAREMQDRLERVMGCEFLRIV